jgi:hypothetical protein
MCKALPFKGAHLVQKRILSASTPLKALLAIIALLAAFILFLIAVAAVLRLVLA